MQPLRPLQEWMQACVMSPDAPDGKTVARRIRPSARLTAAERLDIYRGMYELRLLDALRVDYPGVLAHLGDERFEEAARLYVRHHPSQSYTLNRLGDRFPDFLLRLDGLPRPAFVHDLARFELAETIAFDAEASLAWAGPIVDESQRLKPVDALQLLALQYPVHRYLKGDAETRVPRRRPSWVAVYRKGHAVSHLELNRRSFALLESLCSGSAIGKALSAARLSEAAVFACFQKWFSEELFTVPASAEHL
jgi:hypothetical protein